MKSRRARRLLFLRPLPAGSSSSVYFGRELPDISSRQEVHHRFIALLHGEQLRDLHVSASACSPPSRFSHLFPEHFLLVFPSAAVAEEMFPRLGYRPASAAAPPALVIISVSVSGWVDLISIHKLSPCQQPPTMNRFELVPNQISDLIRAHCN